MEPGPHRIDTECAKCRQSGLGTEHILGFDLCYECREQLKEKIKIWIDEGPVAGSIYRSPSASYGRVGPGMGEDDPQRRGEGGGGRKFDPNEPA
jgi:hypothetical protein